MSTSTPDWWQVEGPWVETPNRDRGGFSGVQVVDDADGVRHYVKRQTNYLFRSVRHPGGRPTLLREYDNFRRFARLGLATPAVVFFDMRRRGRGWEAVLVTRALDGYISLAEGLRARRWLPARRTQVLEAVLADVTRLHRTRRKHGHLYPKEIFIDDAPDTPAVAFLDLELSRRYLSAGQAAASDLKRFLKRMVELGLTEADYRQLLDAYARASIRLPPALVGGWGRRIAGAEA